jgi:hypothetical protein
MEFPQEKNHPRGLPFTSNDNHLKILTITEWSNVAQFYMFVALVFCGIHVVVYVLGLRSLSIGWHRFLMLEQRSM